MKDKFNEEERPKHTHRKRKKHFRPYKKEKYSLSKLSGYENYLDDLELSN